MKIYDCVATEKEAKAIINDYVSEKALVGGRFKNYNTRCECGETTCLTWRNADTLLSVAICDSCGDDDASDVLEVL